MLLLLFKRRFLNAGGVLMSLQTNVRQGNPFEEGDLLKRGVLWTWLNEKQKQEEIFENPLLCKAINQFRWFHSTQQEVLYSDLDVEKIRGLTKYLKEQGYNKR